jgi:hypothetical protein
MEEYLITRPPNARGIYLPQEYILICARQRVHTISRGARKGTVEWITEYDEAAAAILRIIERWTAYKIKTADAPLPPEKLWVYVPQVVMQGWELVNAFSMQEIRAGFDLLIENGYLERRNNPDKGWDRTYQYRFNKAKVQEAVNNLPPFLAIEEWKISHLKMQDSMAKNASLAIQEAIPQVPTQEPPQVPSSSAADAARMADLETQLQEALKQIEALKAVATKEKDPKVPVAQMNPMKDAVAAAFKWAWDTMTPSEKGQIQQAARQLCLAKATPTDIPGLYVHCQKKFDQFGPMALVNHFSDYRKTVGGNGYAKPQEPRNSGTEPAQPRHKPRIAGADYGDTPPRCQ